jgi:hypothetical protein
MVQKPSHNSVTIPRHTSLLRYADSYETHTLPHKQTAGMTTREIPNYPGPLPRKAPAPPKYLVQVVDSESGPKHQLVQLKGTPPPVRPKGLAEPDAPLMAKYSRVVPQRDHVTPSHFYPPRQQYFPPDMKNKSSSSKTRNSLVDVKPSSRDLGSTQEMSNHTHTILPALPKLPTVPRPYVPTSSRAYIGGPLMHARNAAGQILGTGNIRSDRLGLLCSHNRSRHYSLCSSRECSISGLNSVRARASSRSRHQLSRTREPDPSSQ